MSEIRSGVTRGGIGFRESGPPDGPAVVFLHGIGGDGRLWTRQLESVGRARRAIAWDMPGHGGSAPLPETGVDRLAQALAAFVAALGLERPVLVGHSLGGMIVQSFLAQGLGALRGAVLAQTSPAFGGRDPAWARDFVAARLGPLDEGRSMADVMRESVAGMVGDEPDPDGLALAHAVMAETPEAGFRASTTALIGFDRREDLARIAVPTLLVAGSRDQNAPAATMAKMAERIPGAEIVTIAGAGHLAMLERPAEFDAALLAFLDGVAPPSGAPLPGATS